MAVSAKPLQQDRRQQGVTVLAALALLHAQRHALAVNVADLQGDDFAGAQPGTVGQGQRRLVLEGVASENGKNRTLSLCRGWHPAVQRRNGHAEVLGHVLGRYATGQQRFG